MKKFIFVHIGVYCILFACYGKGVQLQTHYKRNNNAEKECSTVPIVVNSLEVDKVMDIVSKLKEVIELERYYKIKGRKVIVLICSLQIRKLITFGFKWAFLLHTDSNQYIIFMFHRKIAMFFSMTQQMIL